MARPAIDFWAPTPRLPSRQTAGASSAAATDLACAVCQTRSRYPLELLALSRLPDRDLRPRTLLGSRSTSNALHERRTSSLLRAESYLFERGSRPWSLAREDRRPFPNPYPLDCKRTTDQPYGPLHSWSAGTIGFQGPSSAACFVEDFAGAETLLYCASSPSRDWYCCCYCAWQRSFVAYLLGKTTHGARRTIAHEHLRPFLNTFGDLACQLVDAYVTASSR